MTPIVRKAFAEMLGTFWLVLAGVGTATIASSYVGTFGVAIAFGLAVLTAVYAIGSISGAHLNPAVSVGAFAAGRMKAADLFVYVASQLAGAILGTLAVLLIARGIPIFSPTPNALAANGFGAHSPGGYDLASCLLAECLLTFFFVFTVLGSTSKRSSEAFAGLAIGLCLTAVHLVGIRVTNMSVNPARSTGPAIVAGGWAWGQLWLFWVAPVFGGAIAGLTARLLHLDKAAPKRAEEDEYEAVPHRRVATSPTSPR